MTGPIRTVCCACGCLVRDGALVDGRESHGLCEQDWHRVRAEAGLKPKPYLTERKKARAAAERPVIVTTTHRGIFFGYATATGGATVTLQRARLCVYWSRDVRGFMGLAASGPSSGCRVGPPATITLRDITAVLEVSAEAVGRWEAAPWAE